MAREMRIRFLVVNCFLIIYDMDFFTHIVLMHKHRMRTAAIKRTKRKST